jgi:hypothetical protein
MMLSQATGVLFAAPPAGDFGTRIRLVDQVIPATEAAVREAVLPFVGPGMQAAVAWGRMKALGFECQTGEGFHALPQRPHPGRTLPELIGGRDPRRDQLWRTLVCSRSLPDLEAWGQRRVLVTVSIACDEQWGVTAVEAQVRFADDPYKGFFSRHPGLHEPTGMPLEQAGGLMRSQGFQVPEAVAPAMTGRSDWPRKRKGFQETEAAAPGRDTGGRPCLDCRATDAGVLGGSVIRIRLYYDETRRVTNSEILKPGEFDVFLAVLPDRSDPPGKFLMKGALFPVRAAGTIIVGGLVASIAIGRP